MASSNGNPELLGSTQTTLLNLSTKHTEDLTSAASQISTLKEKRHSDRPKGRKKPVAGSRDGWVKEVVGLQNEQRPQLPLSLISLKRLVDIEMELVHGDEQNITHKSPASTYSQLMCHSSETAGPPSGPNLASLTQIDKRLDAALQDADRYYRLKKYAAAASRFTIALQDCSKGAVLGKPFSADYEDISKVVGFIESRLAACYLRMQKPDLALPHSHRSIHLNPIHFRSHLQQAMVYRLLGNPCGAARSAMIADYVYWLSGDGKQTISKLIKLYWQGLLEEAIRMKKDFSVLYTPCSGKPTREATQKAEQAFKKLHPTFTAYIFTDPDGGHMLPTTTDWSKSSSSSFILTLGFRRKRDGNFLNKLLHRNCPTFTGPQAPFMPLTPEDLHGMCETLGKKILPVLDFIKCTKLAAGFSTGSGVIERLQYADCLYQLRREQEHAQVLEHTLAELALAPYLQEISPSDTSLLQALMADTMDTLEGKRTDQERVWNAMQKVGLIEDLIYQWEKSYLKRQAHKTVKKQWKNDSEALKQNAFSMPKEVTSTLPAMQGVPQKQHAPATGPSEH
ncbi:spermatogenesis-associated protein 16 [Pangasianodon hypophthalmus]|uniref:spermatogenesis-associated protein 16 n=1 Tax=Pangasianodon hypophthalmus TaxID=310915 RepID=UPI000EFE09AE|nr:spermatogenesis-associated protein 16 [Pangasianodon hypophthalmus]